MGSKFTHVSKRGPWSHEPTVHNRIPRIQLTMGILQSIFILGFLNNRKQYQPFVGSTLTSLSPRWRLKSPASRLFTQPFIQTQIKENIKAPRQWPHKGPVTRKMFPFDDVIMAMSHAARTVLYSSEPLFVLPHDLVKSRSREIGSYDDLNTLNLTGISAALLPRCLSNCRTIGKV